MRLTEPSSPHKGIPQKSPVILVTFLKMKPCITCTPVHGQLSSSFYLLEQGRKEKPMGHFLLSWLGEVAVGGPAFLIGFLCLWSEAWPHVLLTLSNRVLTWALWGLESGIHTAWLPPRDLALAPLFQTSHPHLQLPPNKCSNQESGQCNNIPITHISTAHPHSHYQKRKKSFWA